MKYVARNIRVSRRLPLFLIILSFILFLTTVFVTSKKIGKPFPGYLTFKNSVVGVFNMPHWSGLERGMTHGVIADKDEKGTEIFTHRDFDLVVLLPAITGILFVLIGTLATLYFPLTAGRLPLLFFNFLVGNYLILLPDIHLTYLFSYLYPIAFTLLPATMLHFALIFPEPLIKIKKVNLIYAAPYLFSAGVLVPYFYYFMRDPQSWITFEYLVLFYLIAAYLFWLIRLAASLRHRHREINRMMASYILVGQIIGFVIPLTAVVVMFVARIQIPMNLALPLTLLFAISVFVGVILGRLRQSQMQLVLVEKKAAVGNLMAGLAHELNNPMTFVYSNIEPLRESLQELKDQTASSNDDTVGTFHDLDQLVEDIEEGATRARRIVQNFRDFTYPGKNEPEPADINDIIEKSLRLLQPKWKDRIKIEKKLAEIPQIICYPGELGQVFVNILANACDAIPKEGSIYVSSQLVGSEIEVRIGDTGGGMSKRDLGKIFDPFYTTKEQGEGTGLGLSIVLQIIEKHQGSIEANSELGSGSEFKITLPAKL